MNKKHNFTLKDIARFIRGINFKPADVVPVGTKNSIACMRTKNVQQEIDLDDVWAVDKSFVKRNEQILENGDILVSSANSWNLVGKCCYVPDLPYESSFGGFISVLRADKNIIMPQFLYHWFSSKKIQSLVRSFGRKTTNISNLDIRRCLDIGIYCPDISAQQKIISILNKIDDLIRKRKEQIDLLDTLVKSRFVEMFGEPVINSKKWETTKLGEIGLCKNGMNYHVGETGIELHCLTVSDFKDFSRIENVEDLPKISLNEPPSEDYLLKNGDIVFVRSNGNKSLVGRSVLVYPGVVPTTFSGFCIRFRLTTNYINTDYLITLLKRDSVRIQMMGRGANIQNLNQDTLTNLLIPVPPMTIQKSFSDFIQQTDKSKFALKQSLAELYTLKKSLMQKFFG